MVESYFEEPLRPVASENVFMKRSFIKRQTSDTSSDNK